MYNHRAGTQEVEWRTEGRRRGGGTEGVVNWREKTHDFDTVLSEIPTFVDCAVLALAHRGTAEIMVQNDASAVMIAIADGGCPALVYCICDAHVCSGVKGRGSHDLKIGRVHRVGSMKGEKTWERGGGSYICE